MLRNMEVDVNAHTFPGHYLGKMPFEITPVANTNRRDSALEQFLATLRAGQR